MSQDQGSDPSWDRLRDLPDLDAAPLDADWMRTAGPGRGTAPRHGSPTPAETSPAPPRHGAPGGADDRPVDPRRFRVGADGLTADGPGAAAPVHVPPAPPGPLPGSLPTPEPEPAPRRPLRRRRRGPWIAAVVAIPLLVLGGLWIWSLLLWNGIERVDTDDTLTAGSDGFTNYLIVGTDSREGVDPDLDTAGSIGLGVTGNRSDTMVMLHLGEGGDAMMSLPRDLWVEIPGHGPEKINAATVRGGAPALIRTVQESVGIPVHHYLEVDIAGFLEVVDALGAITIDFPRPACDPKSGLMVRRAGSVRLDAEQALAYVRSRTYTEFDRGAIGPRASCAAIISSGLGDTRGDADLGRTERQRRFLLSVFSELGSTRNPFRLMSVASGVTGGLRVDDTMGLFDAVGLARRLRGLDAENLTLPVIDFDAPDGSLALLPAADADDVLDRFR